jgi:hypothetical protein
MVEVHPLVVVVKAYHLVEQEEEEVVDHPDRPSSYPGEEVRILEGASSEGPSLASALYP